MMRLQPAPALRAHVQGYWFVADLEGRHDGSPVSTAPHTAAILSLNLGRPGVSEFRVGAPQASLLGIQSRARVYRPQRGTYLVMAMLTLPGLARFFPHTGADAGDGMIELGGLLGDGPSLALLGELEAAWTPQRIAHRLDAWFLRALHRAPAEGDARHVQAWRTLLATGRVDAAAQAAELSVRQLERWFAAHVGQSPKSLVLIDRLQASLRAVQQGGADPLEGYSDQAHQIRAWKRGLGLTPGAYRGQTRSPMAAAFGEAELAHFL